VTLVTCVWTVMQQKWTLQLMYHH
jgi:hypothetical protein